MDILETQNTTSLVPDYTKTKMAYKKLSEKCRSPEDLRTNLNAGRFCDYDHQCSGMLCHKGMCRGKMGGEACSDHNECDIYHSCQANKVYPFDTTC